MSVEDAAELIGRRKMSEGSALGWTVDYDHDEVIFLVPEGEPHPDFPDRIEGCQVRLIEIPRPEPLRAR